MNPEDVKDLVSSAYSHANRSARLPWSFYREALRLDEGERGAALTLAEQNSWTRDDLADHIATRAGTVQKSAGWNSARRVASRTTPAEWTRRKDHRRLGQPKKSDMSTARTEKVEVRLTAHDKQILQAAAEAAEQTLSAFVRTNALRQAAAILQDRLRIGLNATRWAAFQAALDAPPRPVPRLAALLQTSARFVTRDKDSA